MPFSEPKTSDKTRKKQEKNPPNTMMYSMPKHEIYEIIKNEDCYIIDSKELTTVAGKEFPTNFYCFTK